MDQISTVTTPNTKENPPKEYHDRLDKPKGKVQGIIEEYGYLLFAAFIPVVLMYLIYLARGLYPFGDGCVLVLDLNGQYVSFYEALCNIRDGDASLLYSFCRNLGGEFLGIYDYYVASPFAWLVTLFPRGRMLEALLFVFLLKTAILGFNMGFYLHKTGKTRNKLVIIAFSIMYAMTSYAIVQQHNSMWIDVVMWLPLLTLGLEELIKKGHFRLFTAMLAISLISNFYIGYMACIYVAAYSVYYYLAHNQNHENNPMGEKNHLLRSVGRVALWSALAIGIAALTVLSARYSLGFGKDEFSNPNWEVTQKFNLFEMFYKFLPSSFDTVRPAGLPFVYCGVLTVMMIPAFFVCKKISNREKAAAAFFILFFIASFATSSIDLIWHGFQKPNWLNYRYSFMLCFFLITLAYRAFEQITFVGRKTLLASTAFIGLFVLIVQELGDYLVEKNEKLVIRPFATIWLALGCLFIYFILICLYGKARRGRESIAIVLTFIVCVEVFLSGLSDMNSLDSDVTYSKYSRYNNFLKTFRPISDMIQENDDGFYRTEKTYHRKTNDNYALKFKGLSCSTSTLNRKTIDFLADIGYASKSHWSKYVGGNPVSDSLLGIKYLVTDKDKTAYYGEPIYPNELFEYNEKLEVVSHPDVYLNEFAMSLAFGVSDDWEYLNIKEGFDTPMDRLNAIITAMLGETETVEVFKTAVQNGDPETVGIKSSTIAGHYKYEVEGGAKESTLTYSYTVPKDTELYFYYPSDYPREVSLKLNGVGKGGFDGGSDTTYRCIASLGTSAKEEVKLEVTIKNSSNNLYVKQRNDTKTFDSYIYYIDWALFTDVMARLQAGPQFEIDHDYTEDHLTGTITTTAADQLIFTSVAFDEGWHVLVDGKEVETFMTADALLTFRIEGAGEHTLEMKYMPAPIRLGIIVSVLSLLIYLLILITYRWLKKVPVLRGVMEIQGDELPEVVTEEDMIGYDEDDIGKPEADVPPAEPGAPDNDGEEPYPDEKNATVKSTNKSAPKPQNKKK